MARSLGVMVDWESFASAATANVPSGRVVELSPSLMVCPHLGSAATGVCVFAARGDAHLRFLSNELGPAVHQHVPLVVIVDGIHQQFHVVGMRARTSNLEQLPDLLNGWLGEGTFRDDAFIRVRDVATPGHTPGRDTLQQLESTPLRLFELLRMRGFHWRHELISGTVPLAVDMLTPLAANRSLMSCVADAETLMRTRAVDVRDGIGIGPFWLRQRGSWLEARVQLDDHEIGCVFHDEPPPHAVSVHAALLAEGPASPARMVQGYLGSKLRCRGREHGAMIAAQLVSELRAWKIDVVTIDSRSEPSQPSERWLIQHDDVAVEVQMPMHRSKCLIWKLMAGDLTAG